MTTPIPPQSGHAVSPAPAKGAPPTKGNAGDDALGFLSLLALLGPSDDARTSPDDNSTTKATSSPSTDPAESDVNAGVALRHRGKRDGKGTDGPGNPAGVVAAHPVLPAPVILGAVPTTGDNRDWRSTATDTTTGAKRAQPIRPDAFPSQTGGDGLPQRSLIPSSLPANTARRETTSDKPASDMTLSSSVKLLNAEDAKLPTTKAAQQPPALPITPQNTAASPPGKLVPLATATLPTTANQSSAVTAAPKDAPALAALSATATTAPEKRRTAATDDTANPVTPFTIIDARMGSAPIGTTTSMPTSATPHPAVVNATREIVAQAQLVGRGQSAEMRLRLRPPDLGDVGVTIRRTATGGLTVHLNPVSPDAASVLRAHLTHLQTALEPHSQGQGAQVTLGQRDASGSSHQRGNGDTQRGEDDYTTTSAPISSATRTPATARTSRGAAIDYDA